MHIGLPISNLAADAEICYVQIELQELCNEVTALRSLLILVQSALLEINGTETYIRCKDELTVLLSNTREAVLQLDEKIEFSLKSHDPVDTNSGRLKVQPVRCIKRQGIAKR
jgi:hypothetical protein